MKLEIKSPKDLWAGLMFIGFGMFFLVWALTHYQMGTAVRMGPAYFPTVLGGLLAFLGVLVLLEAFVLRAEGASAELKVPFHILDMVAALAILAASIYVARLLKVSPDYGILAGTAIISVLTVLYRPAAMPLVLISAGCVVYGYLMKPLGLVLATGALVFIGAYAGHEFKWKEVAILFVVLIIFSIVVFVKGLTLPFPVCPAFMETCPIR